MFTSLKVAFLLCLLFICLLGISLPWGRSHAVIAYPSVASQASESNTPNLAISIQANPEPVNLGGELILLISASNDSEVQATNAEVSVQLPEAIDVISISPEESCLQDDMNMTCVFPVLNPQETAEIAMMVTPQEAKPLVINARITEDERDFQSSDNDTTVTLTVRCTGVC